MFFARSPPELSAPAILPRLRFAWQGRRSALLQHFGEEALALQVFPKHILADIDMTVWVGTFGAGAFGFCDGSRVVGG